MIVPDTGLRLVDNCPGSAAEGSPRQHTKPKAAVPVQAEVARELACEKAFLQGKDKQGRPLVVMVGRRHVRHKHSAEEVKRFMCYCLDTAISTIDESTNSDGTLVYIFDLQAFKCVCHGCHILLKQARISGLLNPPLAPAGKGRVHHEKF